MANLTLKNFPAETHELLKKQAERNHRSLNQEILHILEKSVGGTTYLSEDKTAFLARVRENRKKFKREWTIEEIDAAKREGRP